MTATESNPSLRALEDRAEFIGRHIGPRDEELGQMLSAIGLDSLEALISESTPPSIRSERPLELAPARNEAQVLERLRDMAGENTVNHSLIGLGYHPTHVPPVILRNVLENPGWYTAYTPYQAEISQGRLEGLLNFQQMVMDLTGMEMANASLLDESTAAAEAMTMIRRVTRKNKSNRFLVDADCLPQTIDVVANRATHLGIEVEVVDDPEQAAGGGDYFGILVQYPGASGRIRNLQPIADSAHDQGAMLATAADLLGLTLLKPPGEMGADVVVGTAQRFGVPMGYGGPHAAYLATHEAHRRSVPGRIIGVSRDRHGNPALRMALQTREQHIRREKAMSNICTSQALLAVMAGFYAVWHGAEGIRTIARRVHRLARASASALKHAGMPPVHGQFFDTLLIEVDADRKKRLLAETQRAGFNLRADLEGRLGISFNEVTTVAQASELVEALTGEDCDLRDVDAELGEVDPSIPAGLQRSSDFLTHEVFSRYHSETEMLRYLKRLENRDLSLTHAMIPLGSCTMKLNATAEMIPVTWPEFSELHPLCPHDQARGYHELIDDLEGMLCEITGFDAVSLQPNAGSQGEYAGLLTIHRWQQARGQGHRDVCLIPSSAHGTNPASAQMVGYRIVVVGCDNEGNIDRADLSAKIEKHRDELAALMITYPSTHGVFEQDVVAICDEVRDAGGQVYLDGANMNALVGVSRVAEYADVCHLNLHKTFCIPHGGGGPGVGPIGVREHLAEHLPGHCSGILGGARHQRNPAVAGAPWGSALILPISWAYIALMGRDGLRKATDVAILNANYVAKGLEGHYDILYTGKNGRIAHECIVDLRPFKDAAGISEEDVAKRLIDFGFHAPTMSWPVPGTLMIEPTESESKQELDRFIEAMVEIRCEIDKVAAGEFDAEDNPLKMAPHTVAELTGDEWNHAYSRRQAGWPVASLKLGKFFASVARVDNVYGDRNLVCACPPMEDWLEAS
ncbi:MAG: aminomethyl-transferring glycine dehydrogenase [Wenzhouxiangellaceae bacterium]|nr:aminomethyl-transferring glycine dehydrogenase [Wenzhouxiangellaceae bacterium]MBS3824106.1 aminomethyl-transferring glycine dehydrogenase [Wenzhouxiangellaceae bacterium]